MGIEHQGRARGPRGAKGLERVVREFPARQEDRDHKTDARGTLQRQELRGVEDSAPGEKGPDPQGAVEGTEESLWGRKPIRRVFPRGASQQPFVRARPDAIGGHRFCRSDSGGGGRLPTNKQTNKQTTSQNHRWYWANGHARA